METINDELILLHMYDTHQAQLCAAKAAMQSVVYWVAAGTAGVLAFLTIAVSEGEHLALALHVSEVAWPFLTIFGGTYWLVEMGRGRRSAVAAYQIEANLASRHTSIDPRLLCQHFLAYGGNRLKSQEIKLPNVLIAGTALAASLFLQVYLPVVFHDMDGIGTHISTWEWIGITAAVGVQVVWLVSFGARLLFRFPTRGRDLFDGKAGGLSLRERLGYDSPDGV